MSRTLISTRLMAVAKNISLAEVAYYEPVKLRPRQARPSPQPRPRHPEKAALSGPGLFGGQLHPGSARPRLATIEE